MPDVHMCALKQVNTTADTAPATVVVEQERRRTIRAPLMVQGRGFMYPALTPDQLAVRRLGLASHASPLAEAHDFLCLHLARGMWLCLSGAAAPSKHDAVMIRT